MGALIRNELGLQSDDIRYSQSRRLYSSVVGPMLLAGSISNNESEELICASM